MDRLGVLHGHRRYTDHVYTRSGQSQICLYMKKSCSSCAAAGLRVTMTRSPKPGSGVRKRRSLAGSRRQADSCPRDHVAIGCGCSQRRQGHRWRRRCTCGGRGPPTPKAGGNREVGLRPRMARLSTVASVAVTMPLCSCPALAGAPDPIPATAGVDTTRVRLGGVCRPRAVVSRHRSPFPEPVQQGGQPSAQPIPARCH